MPAHTPEEIDSLFAQALNAGNVDALVALYEPQASLMPSPGTLVAGSAAIELEMRWVLSSSGVEGKAGSKRTAITARSGK